MRKCWKLGGVCKPNWFAWALPRKSWLLTSKLGAGSMTQYKRLVIDTNILIWAVFGQRVRELIADSSERVAFYMAEANFEEACHYISL